MASGNRSRLTSSGQAEEGRRKNKAREVLGWPSSEISAAIISARRAHSPSRARRLWCHAASLKCWGPEGRSENWGVSASLRHFARSKAGNAGWGHGRLGCVCWAKRPGSRTQLGACMMAARVHDLFVGCVSWAEAAAAFRRSPSPVSALRLAADHPANRLSWTLLDVESWTLTEQGSQHVAAQTFSG